MSGLDTRDAMARLALTLARRHLRSGTRSTAQLRAFLAARHLPASLTETLIARCTQEGLLDDAACAMLWARTLRERGYALTAIREQLMEKRLPAGAIERALASLRAEASDALWAVELVRQQRQRRGASAAATPQRLARWLAAHGFDEDVIADALSGS